MRLCVTDKLGNVVMGIQEGIGENFRPMERQLSDGGSAEGDLLEVRCEEGRHGSRSSRNH